MILTWRAATGRCLDALRAFLPTRNLPVPLAAQRPTCLPLFFTPDALLGARTEDLSWKT
jgi:hypothetical protein